MGVFRSLRWEECGAGAAACLTGSWPREKKPLLLSGDGALKDCFDLLFRTFILVAFSIAFAVQAFGMAHALGVRTEPSAQSSHADLHAHKVPHHHDEHGKIVLDETVQGSLHVMPDCGSSAWALASAPEFHEPALFTIRAGLSRGRSLRPPDPGRLIRPPRFA